MGKLRAIVFDYDDTLLETAKHSYGLHAAAAKKMNLKVPSRREFFSEWGKTWEDFIRVFWPDVPFEEFIKTFYTIQPKTFYPLVPGANKVLRALHKKGLLLAIITNRERDRIPVRAQQAGLEIKLFELIYSHDDTMHAKPDPRGFMPLIGELQKRGILKNEIMYIGDNLVDYQFAKGAGVDFVAVLTGVTKKKDFLNSGLHRDLIIPSVAKLPKLLESNGWLKTFDKSLQKRPSVK